MFNEVSLYLSIYVAVYITLHCVFSKPCDIWNRWLLSFFLKVTSSLSFLMSDGSPFYVIGPTDANKKFMDNVDLQKIGLKILVLAYLSLCFAALLDVTRSHKYLGTSFLLILNINSARL